jgi:hypothetical protein
LTVSEPPPVLTLLLPEPRATVSLPVPVMVTLCVPVAPRLMVAPTLPPVTLMARASVLAVKTLALTAPLLMVTFSKPEIVAEFMFTVPPPVMARVSVPASPLSVSPA